MVVITGFMSRGRPGWNSSLWHTRELVHQEREALLWVESLLLPKHNPRRNHSVTLSNILGRSWQLVHEIKESQCFQAGRTEALSASLVRPLLVTDGQRETSPQVASSPPASPQPASSSSCQGPRAADGLGLDAGGTAPHLGSWFPFTLRSPRAQQLSCLEGKSHYC